MKCENGANLVIARSRALQARALAKLRGISVAELLEGLLSDAARAEPRLPDELPGFTIGFDADAPWIALNVGDHAGPNLSRNDALGLAASLEDATAKGSVHCLHLSQDLSGTVE